METGFKLISKKANLNDIIVSFDSDNTHPISLIPKMVKKISQGMILWLPQDLLRDPR